MFVVNKAKEVSPRRRTPSPSSAKGAGDSSKKITRLERQVAHLSTLVHAEKAARHRAMKEMQEYRDELCKALDREDALRKEVLRLKQQRGDR